MVITSVKLSLLPPSASLVDVLSLQAVMADSTYKAASASSGSLAVSGGSSDDELCEYERRRHQNIKENQDLLRSLGKAL